LNVQALAIYLGGIEPSHRIGSLFRYVASNDSVVHRFVADPAFAARPDAPVLSASLLADDPRAQMALWADQRSTLFNGRRARSGEWLLPPFFQNLLPEGVFRDRIAQLRGCEPHDHFEMLAACGKDLPGAVYALPVELPRDELARFVTQDRDSLEVSVTGEPMDEGVSLSGVQPKLAVLRDGERYVARTRIRDAHIIAKLPVVGWARQPELEELSLRMAHAAGVDTCTAWLAPLTQLSVEHGYDLGDSDARTPFLAVERYDRDATSGARVHCEDFAQVLGLMPDEKYHGASYTEVAAVILGFESLGEPAVHELLRRMAVNEMLGNPDMHLKNLGVVYPDGRAPRLSKAYDIVAYAAYGKRAGHALHILPIESEGTERGVRVTTKTRGAADSKPRLRPDVLRRLCAQLELAEKPAATAIRETVLAAARLWPAMIAGSRLTAQQKSNLLAHLEAHPFIASVRRRDAARLAIPLRNETAQARRPEDRPFCATSLGLQGGEG
jgi:serine/threonine-protein kinase HipA